MKDAATKKPSADGLTATAYDERLTTGAYAAMDLMKGSKQANRFSNWSNGSNDGHGHAGHSSCWGSTLDETSGDLAIGYKSQGSFLVDFRQVDTTPQENLGNITYNPSGYIGYDNNARAGISSVAPEGTWFMEQGSSNFYNVRCPYYYHFGRYAYYDKNSRWVYGTGFYDDATYRDRAGSIIDQRHVHNTYYHRTDYCYEWASTPWAATPTTPAPTWRWCRR